MYVWVIQTLTLDMIRTCDVLHIYACQENHFMNINEYIDILFKTILLNIHIHEFQKLLQYFIENKILIILSCPCCHHCVSFTLLRERKESVSCVSFDRSYRTNVDVQSLQWFNGLIMKKSMHLCAYKHNSFLQKRFSLVSLLIFL